MKSHWGYIAILITMLAMGCTSRHARIQRIQYVENHYDTLPLVQTLSELFQHGAEVVRLRGAYRVFDIDVDNADFYQRHAIIYIEGGIRVVLGAPSEPEGIRPYAERMRLNGKQVEVVGRVLSGVSEGASLNACMIRDIQYIGLQ